MMCMSSSTRTAVAFVLHWPPVVGMAVAVALVGSFSAAAVALVGSFSSAVALVVEPGAAVELVLDRQAAVALQLDQQAAVALVGAIQAMDGVTAWLVALPWAWPCTAWWQARPPVGLVCVIVFLAVGRPRDAAGCCRDSVGRYHSLAGTLHGSPAYAGCESCVPLILNATK